MALLLEVLQKSDKTYTIGRGYYCFCQNKPCAHAEQRKFRVIRNI